MKRTTLLAAAACLGLAVASVPTVASAGGQKFDHVVGGGQNNPPASNNIVHFQINAKSGPNGENPEGSFKITNTLDGPPTESYTAEVTCLNVQGDLATVVGRTTSQKNWDDREDSYFLLRIKDVGQGSKTEDEIQTMRYLGDPTVCPDPVEPKPEAITHGNLNVKDAS